MVHVYTSAQPDAPRNTQTARHNPTHRDALRHQVKNPGYRDARRSHGSLSASPQSAYENSIAYSVSTLASFLFYPSSMHPFIHIFIHSRTQPNLIDSFMHSFTQYIYSLPIRSFIHAFLFFKQFIHAFMQSDISLVHSLNQFTHPVRS